MKKCPACKVPLSFWHYQCPMCKTRVWRVHYIIAISILLIGVWLMIDTYMYTEKPLSQKPKDVEKRW
jgi:hypothetical protein